MQDYAQNLFNSISFLLKAKSCSSQNLTFWTETNIFFLTNNKNKTKILMIYYKHGTVSSL